MEYKTNDILVDLPHDTPQDMTMNLLNFSERRTTFVIARGYLERGGSLKSTYKKQLNTLRQQVNTLNCTQPKEVIAGKQKEINGYEIQTDFVRGNSHNYQLQIVCTLPTSNRMLAISYSKTSAMTTEDQAHWQGIKDNLRFA